MATYSPHLSRPSLVPEKPRPFTDNGYYSSLAQRAERNSISDRLLTLHVGETALGKIVDRTATGELATRLNALSALKIAYAARNWRTTRLRLQQEREYAQIWREFEGKFIEHASKKEEVNVVQIGAYDGATHDRLNPLLIKNPSWQAYLIEPMPNAFNSLRRTYANRPNTTFVNRAITDSVGEIDMTHIVPDDGVPPYIEMTATTNPDTITHYLTPGTQLETLRVKTTDLDGLFRENGIAPQDIDMFFIDAEGCDYNILKQLLKREKGLPAFIVAEHDHMSSEEYSDITSRLVSSGYRINVIAHDLLAQRDVE